MNRLLPALLFLAAARAFAGEPPPNLLFAIADDWGPHAGAYGTPWVKTPAFDRVAREGLLFRNAYTPDAKCAPSRACILTGRNPWQLKEAANHLCYFPAEFRGWPEALAAHGWTVGHTTKGWGPGVARDAEGKPRQMTGAAWNRRRQPSPASGIGDCDYAANFADFLAAAPAEKPWCFWYGSIEPHRDYEFGSGVAKGGKKLSDIDRVPACWPDHETVRHDLLDYAFEVEHFDAHLGRMLAELGKRGLLTNTLVVVTSDHGPPFPRGKGNTGELANHVPLAMMWPAGIRRPGRGIDDFVSFIDFAPTFLDLAGLDAATAGLAPMTGTSLREIFRAEKAGRVTATRDRVLIGRERNDIGRPRDEGYPVRGIVRDGWIYLRNHEPSRWPAGNPETGYLDCDGGATKTLLLEARRAKGRDPFWDLCFGKRPAEELYRLADDPDAVKNLAGDAAAASTRAVLAAELDKALRAEGDPRQTGQGAVFDRYPHATQANAGFYEKYLAGQRPKTGWINPGDIEPSPLPETANPAPR